MTANDHAQLAKFIRSICSLLRGPYRRNEYREVILPLAVLRRFDCLLESIKAQVLAEHVKIKAKPETVVRSLLERITSRPSYNLSRSWSDTILTTTCVAGWISTAFSTGSSFRTWTES